MKSGRLLTQSVRHNWRTHLGVVLGCALAALVLTGALMVGDSVKGTLKTQAESRVGKIGEALLCGERFVPWPADKAKRPAVVARMFFPGEDAAGVLLMQGSATRADGKARANKVQVVGVDDDFWKLSPRDKKDSRDEKDAVPLVPSVFSVSLNQRLAAQLAVKAGDDLSLYVEKPGAFSKDAPLSGEEAALVTVKARVGRIVGDEDFGRFALTASQVPPNTVFVPLGELQAKVGLGEKVNVIAKLSVHEFELTNEDYEDPGRTKRVDHPGESLAAQLKEEFVVGNLQNGKGLEIRSPRVFLDGHIVAAARESEDIKSSGVSGIRISSSASSACTKPDDGASIAVTME